MFAKRVERKPFGSSIHPPPCEIAHRLRGDPEKALGLLPEAIDHGLDAATIQGMKKDADLKSLRGDPRFAAIVADARHDVVEQRPK